MQDFLLMVPMLTIFIFGWVLMKKLDNFLDENRKAQKEQLEKDGNALRIGFANPLVADSISDILEQYTRRYPEHSVCLYHDNVEDLLEKVELNKLDIIFLPEQVDIPSDKYYNRKKVMLTFTSVIMKYGGLPIEPIVDGNVLQNMVWIEKHKVPAVDYFIEYVEDGTAPNKPKQVNLQGMV